MPVPVPRHIKPPAHPVIKPATRAPGQQQLSYTTQGALPVPHPGLPPSFIPREEWPGALPSWRRNSQHPIWDTDGAHVDQQRAQDFLSGLAAADNALVIKGPHAEACIPPTDNLAKYPLAPQGIYTRHYAFDNMGAGQVAIDLLGSRKSWEHSSIANYEGVDVYGENRYHQYDSSNLQDAPLDASRSSHLGIFTPILEDQSPGSGPGSGSSPLEPLTPFCDFIDRAVAAPQPFSTSAFQYEDRGVYQDTQAVPNVCAPPIFPSIAEQPQPQQDPITDTVTPVTPVNYKKLTEPLSEWVANYVWKVCTTGYSLPPAFAEPSVNAGPHAVAAPSYLAPAIHTLLLSTLLQPSAVFLALWYIVRLPVYFAGAPLGAEFAKESTFRTALMGDAYVGYEREASETSAPFRIIVLGCMLANKWLDDHTFSNKTWHSISNIPVQTLNALESHALNVFSYDLSISNQQWAQWLSHVMTYHQSLTSPNRPQPISRPSANPHSIVRRAIEEIVQARVVCKSPSDLPQPVFLGLEERLRERAEKEEAMAMDVLEIDLDEDGPLREQYLPKRRASKLGSQTSHSRDVSVGEKWNGPDAAPVKTLPPPAKWSPAGDEPILRDRNRSSGHYVAVQAPPIAPTAYPVHCQPRDMAFNQNWNPPLSAAGYMPVKAQPGYMYDVPAPLRANQPGYIPFQYIAPIARSRSQSVSYDQENLLSRNHMRSYSQARFDYRCSDLRMTAGEHLPIPEAECRWMEAVGHYPYSGPAFVPLPAVGMQPAW